MYLSTVTIQQFIKLSFEEKSNLICEEGNLIDAYETNQTSVKVFSIYDFFVEVLADTKQEQITDIIPYTRGFSFFAKQKDQIKQRVDFLNNLFLL